MAALATLETWSVSRSSETIEVLKRRMSIVFTILAALGNHRRNALTLAHSLYALIAQGASESAKAVAIER